MCLLNVCSFSQLLFNYQGSNGMSSTIEKPTLVETRMIKNGKQNKQNLYRTVSTPCPLSQPIPSRPSGHWSSHRSSSRLGRRRGGPPAGPALRCRHPQRSSVFQPLRREHLDVKSSAGAACLRPLGQPSCGKLLVAVKKTLQ